MSSVNIISSAYNSGITLLARAAIIIIYIYKIISINEAAIIEYKWNAWHFSAISSYFISNRHI